MKPTDEEGIVVEEVAHQVGQRVAAEELAEDLLGIAEDEAGQAAEAAERRAEAAAKVAEVVELMVVVVVVVVVVVMSERVAVAVVSTNHR